MDEMKEIYVDVEVDSENTKPGILKILSKIRPEWKEDEIKIYVLHGGNVNKMFGCHHANDPDKTDCVVIRVYGDNADVFADRKLEKLIMKVVHAAGCGAQLYASFNNGLAYHFTPGEVLNRDKVRDPDVGRMIAKALVQVHNVDLKLLSEEGACQGSKIFNVMWKMFDFYPEGYKNPAFQVRFEKEVKPRAELVAELKVLQDHLENLCCPLKLCHNDLLPENIILNKDKDKVTFIDFEFSFVNYVAYDIAAHFIEWAGIVDMDYSRVPNQETQLAWLRNYLECEAIANGKEPSSVTDKDLQILYVLVNKFTLLANFMSGIGGLVMAQYSPPVEVDIIDFAIRKLNAYFETREDLYALTLPE